ncbi:MAG: response regulator [Planctomycetota bacterium]|jgi:two-component system chemotaxis response regulator CheY
MVHLVVDDSRTVRTFMRRILEDLGVDVIEASDGREALDLILGGASPDLVFVDWDMPVMDGIAFIRTIRASDLYADLPIVMVTKEIHLRDVKEALEAGANEYLMKPFDGHMVHDKLRILGVSV